MPHHLLLAAPVKIRLPGAQVAVVIIQQELAQESFGLGALLGVGGHFNAVAGGKDQPLGDSVAPHEVREGHGEARFLDVHPLAHFHRGRAMVDSDEHKVHGNRESGVGSRRSVDF